MAAAVAAELAWWAWCWERGQAPPPFVGTYALLVASGLAVALVLRRLLLPGRPRATAAAILLGCAFMAAGASLFLPLKFAIPKVVPFWLDPPLASAERALFGGIEPWRILDSALGWATLPADRVYGLWLPVQTLSAIAIMIEPPSRAKTRVLIAYALGWLIIGVVLALLLSSAGPIFYDRLFGGPPFAALHATLEKRGAWVALAETNAMWSAFAADRPSFVSGISAAPSLHVAISLWLYFAARSLAPRVAPFALAYALFMWVASVQLGWHYISDGWLGMAAMAAIWSVSGRIAGVGSQGAEARAGR